MSKEKEEDKDALLQELKAKAYDLIAQRDYVERNLSVVNEQIKRIITAKDNEKQTPKT